jgi:hypothetical protein
MGVGVPRSCAEFGSQESIPVSKMWAIVEHLKLQGYLRCNEGHGGIPVVTPLEAGA